MEYKVGDSVRVINPIFSDEQHLEGVVSVIEEVFYEYTGLPYLYCLEHVHMESNDGHEILWLEFELEPVCINGVYVNGKS